MGDIININSIHDYNEFLGIETLNPLVTFIDFKDVKVLKHKKKLYGFYGIYLKEKIHGKLTYGRSRYDYQEGTYRRRRRNAQSRRLLSAVPSRPAARHKPCPQDEGIHILLLRSERSPAYVRA